MDKMVFHPVERVREKSGGKENAQEVLACATMLLSHGDKSVQ